MKQSQQSIDFKFMGYNPTVPKIERWCSLGPRQLLGISVGGPQRKPGCLEFLVKANLERILVGSPLMLMIPRSQISTLLMS